MNYLMKGLASFLGHSLVFRSIHLLFKFGAIDLISAVTCGVLILILGLAIYFIWHQNPSMNESIINFLGGVSLLGIVLGIVI